MGNEKRSKSNFIMQGAILASASIISRIIGIIYRIPMTQIIGNTGMDYYSTAFEIYNILLLISSYSLPLAVSKLVAAYVAKGERKNAYRIFRCAMLFALITGTIASLIVFFGAEALTNLMSTPLSYLSLRVLGPILLVVAILGVMRGFFQGMGTMVPSAISQLLEQVVNAIVSVAAAYYLYQYGAKVGAVLGDKQNYAAAYGAAGGTLGTGCGAVAALIFVVLVMSAFMRRYKRSFKRDRTKTEAYSDVFRLLVFTIVPVLLSTTIYNISSIVDQGVFKHILLLQGYSAADKSEMWGIFSGQYKLLINVPISIASAMAASLVPSIAAEYSSKNIPQVRRKIALAMKTIMLVAIPCAVGLAVLAGPIHLMLFGAQATTLSTRMMQVGFLSVVFYCISTLSNGILQGIDKMRKPVIHAAVAIVLHLGFLVVMMLAFDWNIYAVIVANMLFALIMCILNGYSIRKAVKYRQEVVRTFIIPAICSVVMGIAVYACYQLLFMLTHINEIATIAAIIIGVGVYGVFILLLKGVTETELLHFPKGSLIVKLCKKFRLL